MVKLELLERSTLIPNLIWNYQAKAIVSKFKFPITYFSYIPMSSSR